MEPLPWSRILFGAFVGTVACVALLAWNLDETRSFQGGVVDAAPDAAGYPLLLADFPDGSQTLAGGNHDGAYFYAIARSLPDLEAAGPYLDRPTYRLQRILFPATARLVAPSDRGDGLVVGLFAVGVAGVFGLGVATGALGTALRGPWWLAAMAPLCTGCMISLRVSTPDPFALALAVGAITASLRGRLPIALVLAVAAALTRESTLLVLAAFAFWRRDRDAVALLVAPVLAAGLWWGYVQFLDLPPGRDDTVIEFGPPLRGWVDAVEFWRTVLDNPSETLGLLGLVNVVAAVAVGLGALARRRLCHPLAWSIVGQLLLAACFTWIPLAPERNGSRTLLPLLVLGLVALASPGVTREHAWAVTDERRRRRPRATSADRVIASPG